VGAAWADKDKNNERQGFGRITLFSLQFDIGKSMLMRICRHLSSATDHLLQQVNSA
jgi:hypothetical protein